MLGAVCVWSLSPQALQECLGVRGSLVAGGSSGGYDNPQGWGSDLGSILICKGF